VSDRQSNMVGRRVEEYLVQKVIKTGGMGAVYLALDTNLDCPVALKFILSDFDDHPEMGKRFTEEAKTLSKLNLMHCPNIPLLYRYFIWEGKAVMAMEYVPGETLEDLVRRRGPIPAHVCVPLVRQALHGLSFAHRIGVIHRDLKPGNLMLNAQGIVKVIDFGIAKKLEGDGALTKTNAAIGTPMYMAPEQIMSKPVTPQTDIYLMGLVLYELLAGQVPFFANSDYEVIIAHVQAVPEPPTIHYPHIPKQVVDAVMKALKKNPADRFSSVEEFIAALPQLPDTQVPVVSPETAPGTANLSGYPPVTLPPNPHLAPPLPPQTPAVSPPFQPVPSQPRQTAGVATAADATAPVPTSVQVAPPPKKSNKALIAGVALACALLVAGGAIWLISFGKPKESGGGTAISNSGTPGPIVHPSPPDDGISAPGADIPAIPVTPAPPKPKPRSGSGGSAAPAPPSGSGNVQSPPPQVAAEEGLSGSWRGTYFDSRSPEDKTLVQLQLKELNGKDIVGTLTFTKSDNTSGQCDLSRSSYSNQQLQLLLHCSGPATEPSYFHTPAVFNVADPAERRLSGKLRYLFPTVSVNIER
jgi:serine/threonine protein kinase